MLARLRTAAALVGLLLVAAAVVLLLPGRAPGARVPEPTRPQAAPPVLDVTQHLRIMPLGDSLTIGEQSSDGYRWPLAQYLVDVQQWRAAQWVGSQASGQEPNPVHEGHSGWRIDQLTPSVPGWMAATAPDLVLLQAGTNDALQGAQADTMLARMRALATTILSMSPGVLLIIGDLVPTWYGTDRDIASVQAKRYNAGLPSLVDSLGPRVTLARWSRVLPTGMLVDGIHPADPGYARLAWVWMRCIGTLASRDGVVRWGEDPLPMPLDTGELCHTSTGG